MKLKKFIKRFVVANTTIRLWHPGIGGCDLVKQHIDAVGMEHEILNPNSNIYDYRNYKVVGVTDINVDGHYPEAVNIIIERN